MESGRLKHTQFDNLVVETDSHLIETKRYKTYTLYCLWLTYIVQCGCKELYQHLLDFHNNVTCHWFDSGNTDRAGVFVDRANAWFLRKTDCGQLLRYAGLKCESLEMPADEDPHKEDNARNHACRLQASITLESVPRLQTSIFLGMFAECSSNARRVFFKKSRFHVFRIWSVF